jgi:hypothetical protein
MLNTATSTCRKKRQAEHVKHKTTQHSTPQHNTTQHKKARQGKARQGKARQGKARQGKARQGKARQGKITPKTTSATKTTLCDEKQQQHTMRQERITV